MGDGPVAYWRLGESSGTNAADSSGNGLNGTYTGGVTLGQPGALVDDANTAVAFNGSTGYVTVGAPAALKMTTQFSVEAWVYPTSISNSPIITNKEGEYEWSIDLL